MVLEISGWSAPKVYEEALFKVPLNVKSQMSRNGPVLRVPGPTVMTLHDPRKRVMFDSVRKANPYFHVMEFIWMMSGDNSTRWISQFNKGFKNYAEANGVHHGAYGHRWREHFGHDQLHCAVDELHRDPESRRVVLSMWDPDADQGRVKKDLPCNTHIYLEINEGKLDMTVCNRSNDLFWGMLGSNIVHMTLLQELLAVALHVELGTYQVFTKNLHVYPGMPRFEELWSARHSPDLYLNQDWAHFPVLQPGEQLETFFEECWAFIHAPRETYRIKWLEEVAAPMYFEYMQRIQKPTHPIEWISTIKADDWRAACRLWETWHA